MMRRKGTDWRYLYAFLIILSAATFCFSAGPVFKHEQPVQDEFRQLYSQVPDKSTTPKLSIGSGAPTFLPGKVGDIFVSTTTGTIYISTSTASSGGWAAVN